MTAPHPYALLDTTDLTVLRFATFEALQEGRAALVARQHTCISLRLEDGTWWIDGMNVAQIEKIVRALAVLDKAPMTNYGPGNPHDS